MHNRSYDIIVFGATGFTGKLVVEYLIEHYGVDNELFTWAIAGRNEDKIKKVIETINTYGFETAATKFSISDTSKLGGNIGKIKILVKVVGRIQIK